ncbi:cache domain-containing protein [Noviherbaspirillum galbum]|uniref:Single Cache domain-containing protein n=1 Tax=Noviherbaspirillum galbum TaxID=2709383 RepID=A0A6B3SQQ1_9BURK|nr:cache domain-containing protein [Noviherbaspirillum galbum]NEX62971.1 hypothetical protein [Noviherbaspirillum galbum]
MNKSILAALFLLAGVNAHAQAPTDDDVVKLVKKAIAQAKQSGMEPACRQFADPTGGFIQGELYVYVHDLNGKMICHATNPKLNGKDMIDMHDVEGKKFNREMIELAKSKGNGWINYKFLNPATKTIMPKSSYVERMDGYIVGAGVYRAK